MNLPTMFISHIKKYITIKVWKYEFVTILRKRVSCVSRVDESLRVFSDIMQKAHQCIEQSQCARCSISGLLFLPYVSFTSYYY